MRSLRTGHNLPLLLTPLPLGTGVVQRTAVTAMSSLVTSVSLAHFPSGRWEVFGQRRPAPPLAPPLLVPRTVARTMARTAMTSGSLRSRIVSASHWAPGQTPPPWPGSPPELLREIGGTSPSPDQWLGLIVAVSGEAPGPVGDGGEVLPGLPSPRGVPVENFVHRPGGHLDRQLGGGAVTLLTKVCSNLVTILS